MIIQGADLLVGEDFKLIKQGSISIEKGKILEISKNCLRGSKDEVLDGRGTLAIPGFVNAHVHLADSVAKDKGLGKGLTDLVDPIHGIKMKLLAESSNYDIISSVKFTLKEIIRCGITTFCDFREGGLEGIRVVKEALKDFNINAIILTQPNYYFTDDLISKDEGFPRHIVDEIIESVNYCQGLGLSGPNELSDRAMIQLSNLACRRHIMIAIHVAESYDTRMLSLAKFGIAEIPRAVKLLKPDILVHLTDATDEELDLIANEGTSVVCCPRSNGQLGVGFPPIDKMVKKGITVALGTDNVMLNSPDMFKEMDYVLKATKAFTHKPDSISPKDVLKMATVNGARVLKLEDTGSIDEGKQADIAFIDTTMPNMQYISDPVAAVVHRANPSNIKAVMVRGKLVYGSLPKPR